MNGTGAFTRGFTYLARPARVVFGVGAVAKLPELLDELGLLRLVVLTTPGQRAMGETVSASVSERIAGIFAQARMHVPVELAAEARAFVRECEADGVLAIGGGSTVGLGKAIALTTGLPTIAVPTTYAGSEMTTIYGLTESGLKTTGRSDGVLPKLVVYDPALTLSLSAPLSASSGLNAIAHAVEGLYAVDGNPIVSILAEESIRAMAAGLPVVVDDPRNLEARAQCLYGAWLAGTVLGSVSMALHHKLCHTLGGSFDLPHAQTHAVVLPHALEYNAQAAPEAAARVARALGSSDAVAGLRALARRIGAPDSLRELGMRAEDLDRAAELAATTPYPNPRPVERDAIRALLGRAFGGTVVAA